jgi:hypothetical protein
MERQDAADLRTFIQRINAQVIDYLRFTELHQLMYECQLLSQGASEPICMALEAVTCGGKSTLLRSYLERFPPRRTPSGKYVPVFYFETPASVTPKRMLQAMLTKLGDPGAQHGDITILKERLCWYLKQCGTVLVMMDDFHHLIDLTTDRVLSKVAEMLKDIIKTSGVPFLVVGVEHRVFRILRHPENQQLSRLFREREVLYPFAYETDEQHRAFDQLVTNALQVIGIEFTDDLASHELNWRLFYATDGVVGYVMMLLRQAAIQGYVEPIRTQVITLSMLQSAFRKSLAMHLAAKHNPFSLPLDTHFVPPAIPEPDVD